MKTLTKIKLVDHFLTDQQLVDQFTSAKERF